MYKCGKGKSVICNIGGKFQTGIHGPDRSSNVDGKQDVLPHFFCFFLFKHLHIASSELLN